MLYLEIAKNRENSTPCFPDFSQFQGIALIIVKIWSCSNLIDGNNLPTRRQENPEIRFACSLKFIWDKIEKITYYRIYIWRYWISIFKIVTLSWRLQRIYHQSQGSPGRRVTRGGLIKMPSLIKIKMNCIDGKNFEAKEKYMQLHCNIKRLNSETFQNSHF